MFKLDLLFRNIASPAEQKKKTVTIDMSSDVKNQNKMRIGAVTWDLAGVDSQVGTF